MRCECTFKLCHQQQCLRQWCEFELFENITFGVQFGELSDKDITIGYFIFKFSWGEKCQI